MIYINTTELLKVKEFAILYGYKFGKFRLSTGLSTVWGNNRGRFLYSDPDPLWGSGEIYEFLGYHTIGIPGEIRFLTSTKHVGIGITAFGNYNQKRLFAGLNIGFYIGKLKNTGLPSD